MTTTMTTLKPAPSTKVVRGLFAAIVLSLALPAAGAAPPAPTTKPAVAKQRDFLFTYAATVTGLAPGQEARVWLPVPPSNEDQQVAVERKDLPGEAAMTTESKYGNRILSFKAKAT